MGFGPLDRCEVTAGLPAWLAAVSPDMVARAPKGLMLPTPWYMPTNLIQRQVRRGWWWWWWWWWW